MSDSTVPAPSAQMLADAGINVFAVKLLAESFTQVAGAETTPLTFKFQGVIFTLQKEADHV